MSRSGILAGWLLVGLLGALAPAAAKIQPVVGEYKKVTVRRGDTLFAIARKHDVGVPNLMRLNSLSSSRVRPGQKLLLPLRSILPRFPANAVVLNVPERRLYLFRHGELVARHAVAIGRPGWPTAIGTYKIASRVANPTWTPTANMVAREGIKDEPVPAGPNNPLGDRWMGWSTRGFGFHSTNAPRSIGRATSHGCVRLYPRSADRMFRNVFVGMPIYSIYEPVKIGKSDGKYYLSVSPDLYGKGLATLARVQQRLDDAGLLPLVDSDELREIVRQKASYPMRIVGRNEKVVVNGRPVEVPLAPSFVYGSWSVPLRAVAETLGGSVTMGENGAVQVRGSRHLLEITPGQTQATIDGRPLKLPVTPTVVEGNLVAPVRALMAAFDARFERDPDRSIQLTAPGRASV